MAEDNAPVPIGQRLKAVLRGMRAVGPLLIAQSDRASQAYARHRMRIANVDTCKTLLSEQVRHLSELQAQRRANFFAASDEERVRIRADIEFIDREIRKLGIVHNAMGYLENIPEEPANTAESEAQGPRNEVSPAWLDRFNELARYENEPWRQDLLARALARESENPGTVGTRGLWFIGTVEEQAFHFFAGLLDISVMFIGSYFIPRIQSHLNVEYFVPQLRQTYRVGSLIFQLDTLGLFGDHANSVRNMRKGFETAVAYDDSAYLLTAEADTQFPGLVLTTLGDLIASLYQPTPNDLGRQIFSDWIEGLDPIAIRSQKIHQP